MRGEGGMIIIIVLGCVKIIIFFSLKALTRFVVVVLFSNPVMHG